MSNTEGDNDVSSLRSDAEAVSQAQGANSMNKSINVQSYTNKNIPKANANQTMTIPVGNGSVGQAATKAQDTILHTPDNSRLLQRLKILFCILLITLCQVK